MDKVFFGVPIRNRAWILPKYLDAFLHMDYPKELISVFFLVNDSQDATFKICELFKKRYNTLYRSIELLEFTYEAAIDRRSTGTEALYPHFARLKNVVRGAFINSRCDYWLQVDSDSPVEKNTLKQLLRHKVHYVAGTCNVDRNLQGKTLSNVMRLQKGSISKYDRVTYAEMGKLKDGELLKVDWVGGIVLMSRTLAERCCYNVIEKEHNDTLGLCRIAQRLGYSIYVDPSVYLKHYMHKGVLS